MSAELPCGHVMGSAAGLPTSERCGAPESVHRGEHEYVPWERRSGADRRSSDATWYAGYDAGVRNAIEVERDAAIRRASEAERLNALLPDELTRLADRLEAKVPVPSNRTYYEEGWLDAIRAVQDELRSMRAALRSQESQKGASE